MEAMLYKPNHKYISEEQFNEVTLKTLKENKAGITEYPVLDFDERALDMLSSGVKETLKSSKVKVAGGKGYEFLKRLFDIVMSFTALLVLAIPLLIIALIIFLGVKGNPIFSQVRLTKEGIDELPQLFNVLKGDMSIIGPRPPLPREVVLYTPHHMDRLLVKGGLSCICQTEGRSDMPFEEWVDSDIKYIENRSAGFDLKLMFKTVSAVLLRKGAK